MFQTMPAPTAVNSEELDAKRTLHEASWTKGDYTLVRRQIEGAFDFSTPRWEVRADRDLPSIHDNADYHANVPEFGVNWAAMGTKTADEARRFGYLLMSAAEAADHFNQIVTLSHDSEQFPQ